VRFSAASFYIVQTPGTLLIVSLFIDLVCICGVSRIAKAIQLRKEMMAKVDDSREHS
jgi:hypothetical protein